MFKKLSLKITAAVLAVCLVAIAAVGLVSYAAMRRLDLDTYRSLSQRAVAQNSESCRRYLDLISEKAKSVYANEDIAAMLSETDKATYRTVPQLTVLQHSAGVLSVSLYNLSGEFAVTVGSSTQIALEQYTGESALAPFFRGTGDSAVIALSRQYTQSDPAEGAVTYVSRVYDGDGVCQGYLFIDISLAHLYDYYCYGDNGGPFDTQTSFVADGRVIFGEGPEHIDTLGLGETVSDDGRYLIFRENLRGNIDVVSMVPLEKYTEDMHSLAVRLLIIAAVLTAVSAVLSLLIARSVTGPLGRLMKKMQSGGD